MSNRDLQFVHFWKTQIPNLELEKWCTKMELYSKKYWLIFFEEKLRRNEQEIYIK